MSAVQAYRPNPLYSLPLVPPSNRKKRVRERVGVVANVAQEALKKLPKDSSKRAVVEAPSESTPSDLSRIKKLSAEEFRRKGFSYEEKTVALAVLKILFPKNWKGRPLSTAYWALSCGDRIKNLDILVKTNTAVIIKGIATITNGVDKIKTEVVIKIAKDAKFDALFQKEFAAMSAAHDLDPEHTVAPVDLWEGAFYWSARTDLRTMIISKYEGETLLHHIKQHSQITLVDYISIVKQFITFFQKVTATPDLTCVLRDIKPENILFKDGVIKFIDFNLSGKHGEKISWNTGTRSYRSPTTLTGKFNSSEMLFSFGCVLYELLRGKYLFCSKTDHSHPAAKTKCHLDAVYNLIGEPSQDFLKTIPLDTSTELLNYKDCADEFLGAAPSFDNMRESIISEFQDSEFKTENSRIILGSVDPEVFADRVLDFIKTLLQYDNPPTVDELLAHPLLYL